MFICRSLGQQTDPLVIANLLYQLPYFVWLDSEQQGRYSILSAQPFMRMISDQQQTEIITEHGSQQQQGDPFSIAKQHLQSLYRTNDSQLPFTGGAIGYFSYDLARYIEHIPEHSKPDIDLPLLQLGFYDWACIIDHQQQQSYFVYHDDISDIDHLGLLQQLQIATTPLQLGHQAPLAFKSNLNANQYRQAFDKIQQYIHDGDCYEINFSQRFSTQISGDPLAAYLHLRHQSSAPAYSAYIQTANGGILSFSPEQFLHVDNDKVSTKPIKGTRPRGDDQASDKALANQLQHSEKDRAENLMIVDLLRNDLGRVCQTGSIKVEQLFAIASFSNVHHMFSTISGQLEPQYHALDVLRACFPGGSITGAPKIRAMEIIDELEPNRRNVYCGAIGYIDFNGNMDTNIAIRSLIWHRQQLHCSAGGAIIADSDCDAEYQETLDKVQHLLNNICN